MGLMWWRVHTTHEVAGRKTWFGPGYRISVTLEGEGDVDEGSDSLDRTALLGMVDEVLLARLVFGVPFEDVELSGCQPIAYIDQGMVWR
jgi:hypothetical protein